MKAVHSRVVVLASLLFHAAFVPCATAQPRDGDVVMTLQYGVTGRCVVYTDPTGSIRGTLFKAAPSSTVELGKPTMARNNSDLLLSSGSLAPITGRTDLLRIRPNGNATTFASLANSSPHSTSVSIALDHDDLFVAAGSYYLCTVSTTGAVTTLAITGCAYGTAIEKILIDRDPGRNAYVLAHNNTSTLSVDWLSTLNRTGTRTTLVRAGNHPESDLVHDLPRGDYLCIGPGSVVYRVTQAGSPTTFTVTRGAATALARQQDGKVWIGAIEHGPAMRPVIHCVDEQGAVLLTRPLFGLDYHTIQGLEIYGSRKLVCSGSGQPGTIVNITVQSRRPGDANAPYVLACSLARRPGFRASNGEWLDLRPDPLFFVSSSGLGAGIFNRLQGVLDSQGTARVSVNIPAWFPPRTGITVFVAGVVYSAAGIRTVTGTHWFVLN